MSIFKKIFKAKKGGTLVGNLIRAGVNKASGGILGNGVQRDKRDAKAEAKKIAKQAGQSLTELAQKMPNDATAPIDESTSKSFDLGLNLSTNTGEQVQKAGNSMILIIVAIVVAVVFLFKRK